MSALLDTNAFLWFISGSDRLIIAQGITEKIPIITSDAVFAKYPVDIIW